MKKIALEEHYMAPHMAESFRNIGVGFDKQTLERLLARLSDFDGERLDAMDQSGIDISVLSLAGVGVQGERGAATAAPRAREANDFLAGQILRHPDRYRGFAALPMQDAQAAADELARTVREHAFLGALISGPTHGHYLDEERYLPFWEQVARLDVPVYVHPGNSYQLPQSFQDHPELIGPLWGWTVDTATHALRLVFSGLFDRFPNLQIILGHMGETLPLLLWRIDTRYSELPNFQKLRKPPSRYIQENFVVTTSGVFSAEPLLCTLAALGEDNVLFSVDYPFESSHAAARFMDTVAIPETTREKISHGNAERVLRIEVSRSV
jgi:2,3-dihydroxybenzoate decarboxylase